MNSSHTFSGLSRYNFLFSEENIVTYLFIEFISCQL